MAGSVTVTEYVPGEETELLTVVTVPQLNVAPVVVEEAVMVTLVTAQVKLAGGAILKLGTVIF